MSTIIETKSLLASSLNQKDGTASNSSMVAYGLPETGEIDGAQQQQPQRNEEESDENPGSPVQLEHHLRMNKLYRSAIFATFPVFSAYAGMITLQRGIKNKLGITNDDKERSDLFGVAVGSIYAGNCAMRLLHNILLSFLLPRQRAMLSYILVAIANVTIVTAYWVFESQSLAWVFIAYLLSGFGIGSFESCVMSTLSPLGHETKSWAVLGLPVGFNGVAVGFYVVFSIVNEPNNNGWLHGIPYFIIAGLNVAGLIFFKYGIPTEFPDYAAGNDDVKRFKDNMMRWREWAPKMKWHLASLTCDMICVSLFSSLPYFVYDVNDVPLWPYAEKTIPKNIFQTWFNLFSFTGDFVGRKIIYAFPSVRQRNPMVFLIFSVIGAAMILSKTALAAPFGMFFVMFANGLCYASGTRRADSVLDDRFILVALSAWLFLGDVGSYTASVAVQPFQIWIGGVPVHAVANITNATRLNFTSTTT